MNQRLASLFGAPIRSRLIDYGTGLVMALLVFASLWSLGDHEARFQYPVLVLFSVALLLLRHRSPRIVLGVILALAVSFDAPVLTMPALLALLAVTTDCEPIAIISGAGLAAVALALAPELHGDSTGALRQVVSRLAVAGLASAFGLYLRARGAYVAELQARASGLDRERELTAAQAVADERVRIARELHDVVAHKVSLMVVQAQAATATATDADEATLTALGRVGNLGREALAEMHRMLGVLRIGDGGEGERAPQPGVAELPALIQATRDAGLQVHRTTTGDPYPLPPGIDLSAYRIVQEALTNVVRHAVARNVEVRVSYGSDGLELEVSDDGRGVSPLNGLAEARHGLVGMRERVALYGGTLSAGNRTDGAGYRVTATLPVSGHSVPAESSSLVSAIVRRVS